MANEPPLRPEVIIPGRGTGGEAGELDDALLEFVAWLMDRAVLIPGTKVRVGLDAVLGLLPIGGDFLASLVQSGLVLTAVTRYRVPRAVAARMIANILIDLGVGAVPFAGDIFDVYFKANTRNLSLLREARACERQGQAMPAAPSRRYLIGMVTLLGVGMLALLLGFVALATWVVKLVWRGGGA